MKKGFTLAEVLITLAIIGVVATLTMPSIIGNYRNKVLMTQLQNTLNLVQNATVNAMNDMAAENFRSVVSTHSASINFLKNYFDTVATCQHESAGGSGFANCLAEKYTSFDQTQNKTSDSLVTNRAALANCAVTTSGATICLWPIRPGGMDYDNVYFLIDVNGVESPNVNGKDLFWFRAKENGKLAYSFQEANRFVKEQIADLKNLKNPDPAEVEELAKMEADYNAALKGEVDGTSCKTNSANPEDVCLPYIISHGWKFKF